MFANHIKIPYFSYGTIYGTVRNYDLNGSDIGARNIATCGVFFLVKTTFDLGGETIIDKRNGTGVTVDSGTNGYFTLTLSNTNTRFPPKRYPYACFLNESGTTFVDGTSQLKVIGSGVFEIVSGVRYGTI